MYHLQKRLLYMDHKVIYNFIINNLRNKFKCFSDPDAGGIPSQFPVQEDTQFCQILREALDFFGVDESKQNEFFLVDYKTRKQFSHF